MAAEPQDWWRNRPKRFDGAERNARYVQESHSNRDPESKPKLQVASISSCGSTPDFAHVQDQKNSWCTTETFHVACFNQLECLVKLPRKQLLRTQLSLLRTTISVFCPCFFLDAQSPCKIFGHSCIPEWCRFHSNSVSHGNSSSFM